MPFLGSCSISSNVLVIFVLLRVPYSQRLKKRQIHLSTKKSKQTVLKLVVPERTFLWPIILIDVTMKKDNFATSMVLNFERLWLMYLRSLWFYENFLFYFCPIHEWTNTLKLVGEEQTPSRTKPERSFGLRESNIKRQTSTTALANKET